MGSEVNGYAWAATSVACCTMPDASEEEVAEKELWAQLRRLYPSLAGTQEASLQVLGYHCRTVHLAEVVTQTTGHSYARHTAQLVDAVYGPSSSEAVRMLATEKCTFHLYTTRRAQGAQLREMGMRDTPFDDYTLFYCYAKTRIDLGFQICYSIKDKAMAGDQHLELDIDEGTVKAAKSAVDILSAIYGPARSLRLLQWEHRPTDEYADFLQARAIEQTPLPRVKILYERVLVGLSTAQYCMDAISGVWQGFDVKTTAPDHAVRIAYQAVTEGTDLAPSPSPATPEQQMTTLLYEYKTKHRAMDFRELRTFMRRKLQRIMLKTNQGHVLLSTKQAQLALLVLQNLYHDFNPHELRINDPEKDPMLTEDLYELTIALEIKAAKMHHSLLTPLINRLRAKFEG